MTRERANEKSRREKFYFLCVIFSLLLLHQNREIRSLVHTKERRKEDKREKKVNSGHHTNTRANVKKTQISQPFIRIEQIQNPKV